MESLNFPSINAPIKRSGGKLWIFEFIRKKYVVLTPEEWVRQHVLHYFVKELNYPKSLIAVEKGLVYNQLNKRADIVVFDREGKHWLVVECKAPHVEVNESTFNQASVYNAILKSPFVSVTNGVHSFCYAVRWEEKQIELIRDFPIFPEV